MTHRTFTLPREGFAGAGARRGRSARALTVALICAASLPLTFILIGLAHLL